MPLAPKLGQPLPLPFILPGLSLQQRPDQIQEAASWGPDCTEEVTWFPVLASMRPGAPVNGRDWTRTLDSVQGSLCEAPSSLIALGSPHPFHSQEQKKQLFFRPPRQGSPGTQKEGTGTTAEVSRS